MVACIRMWSAIAVATSCWSGAIAAQNPAQPPKNAHIAALEKEIAGKEQQPAEQVFKDIRVFKGMPAIRVLRIMEMAFNANLGVDCDHCHAVDDWSSGVKRQRDVAREMWTLRAETQEKLRKITGKADLPFTCYSCHKGQPKPAFAPEQ
jgi:Photosynthetic reaction centre cytochrome C subunit